MKDNYQESGVRNQGSELRGQGSGSRTQEPGIGGEQSEVLHSPSIAAPKVNPIRDAKVTMQHSQLITQHATFLFAALLFLLSACNVNKYIPDGKYLYKGASIEVIHADSVNVSRLTPQLNLVLTPTPTSNQHAYRYLKEESKRAEGKGKPDKNMGKAPIFYESAIPEQVMRLLNNRAENLGYFYSRASYSLDTIKEKQIKIDYQIRVGQAYRLDSVYHEIRDSAIAKIINEIEPRTLLKYDEPYNLFLLKNERSRIENSLKKRGYYYFNGEDLEYLADTVNNNYRVSLLLKLKPALRDDVLKAQRIERVVINNDYELDQTGERMDTFRYDGLEIMCLGECYTRPMALAEAIAYRPGDLYQPQKHQATLQRLSDFNTYRYINVSYDPVSGSDSTLALIVNLTPRLPRTVEGEFGVAYSADYFGPEIGLSYINRNLLQGAELFRLDGDFTYAFYLGGASETRIPNSGVYRITASMNIPRLWIPNRQKYMQDLRSANTQIQLGGNLEAIKLRLAGYRDEIAAQELTGLQTQIEADSNLTTSVALYQLSARYAYAWQKKVDIKHTFSPFTVRYQNPRVADDEVLTLARSLNVSQSQNQLGRFDRMLLYSPDYVFLYDSRLRGAKKHNLFYQQRVALNFNATFPSNKDTEISKETSQYLQWESDIRYYFVLNAKQQIATRLAGAVAFPFSERAIVPYFDLYTVGGPNSLRAFSPRGVGPSVAVPDQNNLLSLGGYGNLKLESSIEFRQAVIPMFELAFFADAGNVWLYKTQVEPTPFDFSFSNFIDELALDAGIGFRLDLDFLLFRLDVAYPLREPFPLTGTIFENRKFLKKLAFVLAFGYPF